MCEDFILSGTGAPHDKKLKTAYTVYMFLVSKR